MNREDLIENIAYEISAPISCDKNCKTCEYDESNLNCMSRLQATNVVDYVIKHEQDTLKAFVEWLKDNYGIKYGNARALYNRINKEDKYQRGYYSGKATALLDFMNELDKVLENFLKEREDV